MDKIYMQCMTAVDYSACFKAFLSLFFCSEQYLQIIIMIYLLPNIIIILDIYAIKAANPIVLF